MVESKKVIIEFHPTEIEILCDAILNFTPADKAHEMILYGLYARLKRKLEESQHETP